MTWNCFHGRRTGQRCMKGKPIWSQQAHQFLGRLPEADGKEVTKRIHPTRPWQALKELAKQLLK